ncbi:carboxymuconolactone decarboxylase family protein [Winogradskyella sp. UBA3174]|uniref:carboxymuconolactone decarboxylase family protein n=1 Tax=Winogradskyella sp. UBA3174 TaxID=1947785 RepID=UPI0025CC482B|nr:carboxymuconolactone decarboxylase family protein [Winogradskyella sp. UBA3174]|tara:strand:- start:24239 stop:24841 length:603 start_codon:yes stop_codon:yes gene_type:complete
MALVTPLSADHDLETKKLAEFFNETLGFCPNSVLTMQRRPAISKAFINLNKAVMANEGRVTSALKRMIAWVSSNSTGCRYCQAHAIRAAERYGAEQEQLDNIWEYRTHAAFSDAERAALDFSLAASILPNAVNADIKKRLYDHWDEGEIVEMLGVISLFGYLNRWNDSMGTTMEESAIESGDQYLGKHGFEVGKHDGLQY